MNDISWYSRWLATWWRHQIETFSVLLCGSPHKAKWRKAPEQPIEKAIEKPSCSLWRRCNEWKPSWNIWEQNTACRLLMMAKGRYGLFYKSCYTARFQMLMNKSLKFTHFLISRDVYGMFITNMVNHIMGSRVFVIAREASYRKLCLACAIWGQLNFEKEPFPYKFNHTHFYFT